MSSPSLPIFLQSLTDDDEDDESRPLAESLLLSIADLLFCPGFTAQSSKKSSSVSEDKTSNSQYIIIPFLSYVVESICAICPRVNFICSLVLT